MTNKKLIQKDVIAKEKAHPPAPGEQRLITEEESELTWLRRDTVIKNINGRITIKGSFLKNGAFPTLNLKDNFRVAKRMLQLFWARAGYQNKKIYADKKGAGR